MNTDTEPLYLSRVVERYEGGRIRRITRVHRVGCPNTYAGTWRPTRFAPSDLPVCCADLDVPQAAEKRSA